MLIAVCCPKDAYMGWGEGAVASYRALLVFASDSGKGASCCRLSRAALEWQVLSGFYVAVLGVWDR